ncbi:hypothetical protein [Desulforhopalus sp. IMCC35007]|uniref:hypothetical protein n=1 Tax=Desulforhopalus sp. IMCC35007 TaxID=2569543 RepID=UPI0010AE7FA2|nr:hypothetical protein [Desulforhopalus sp. IMCC35007]TKB09906.1 hypothetical protein FCL48_08025 [Desulforhopalus sp. IMCC35007]
MKKTFLKVIALTAALSFGAVSVGFAAGGSIGHGDISVFKNGQLSAKLSGQNPVEDGALLVCDGKCMLKSEGISIIATDKSQVAVTNEDDTFKLYVKEGTVDYVISSNARKIAFYTPQGTYTVAEVVFNASNNSVVKGSVTVAADGQTEISVTEGKMVFATADGMKTVDANNKIVLAVAPAAAGGGAEAKIGTVIFGAASLGVVGGVVAAIADDDDTPSVAAAAAPAPTPPVVRPRPTPTASPSN